MNLKYQWTLKSCFIGYIVQAIVNNFVPLLFLTFQNQYNIPLSQITILITLNFATQFVVDLASVFFIDRIGYRASAIIAHVCVATGLILLTIMPEVLGSPFLGLLIAVLTYAIGGGLLEVIVSPIVEACPTKNKEQTMSLLHSFYCWGVVGIVLISTLFFVIFGVNNWKILALFWALIPMLNCLLFFKVPLAPLVAEGEGLSVLQLFKNKYFWLFVILILCAGASENAISQWASTFAEKSLGVSKTIGDLAGPTLFAVLMGLSRVFYAKFGTKGNLTKMMFFSGILCIISYLIISFSSNSIVGLMGIAVCGLSVGIMWPGIFSKASSSIRGGGTAMFAILALSGDVGCSSGPTFVGLVANLCSGDFKVGIFAAIIFPIILTIGIGGIYFFKSRKTKHEEVVLK